MGLHELKLVIDIGARATIFVYLPGKKPAVGANITGVNRNAWNKKVGSWKGTIGEDGSYTWGNIDTGTFGDFYDFEAIYVDEDGVKWVGRISDRIAKPTDLAIVLSPEYRTIHISKEAIENLAKQERGKSLLEGIKELQKSMSAGLVHASITLSTWILEGLIKIKAQNQEIWKEEYEQKTFGQLVSMEEVNKMLPVNMRDRIKGVANWRKPHAHFKGAKTVREEAQLVSYLVKDLAEEWFGKKTTL